MRDEEQSVTELQEGHSMSQPAISQHLKVLAEAGLVTVRKDGRRRLYRATPEPLLEIYDWVAHYQRFWGQKMDALSEVLEAIEAEEAREEQPDTH